LLPRTFVPLFPSWCVLKYFLSVPTSGLFAENWPWFSPLL
jgi:hypothetical protein